MYSLFVFLDDWGYFMKPKNGSMFHQLYARCEDHVWASSSLLIKEDSQLQHDINSGQAKTGVAGNRPPLHI
jgi:hypothetical protein